MCQQGRTQYSNRQAGKNREFINKFKKLIEPPTAATLGFYLFSSQLALDAFFVVSYQHLIVVATVSAPAVSLSRARPRSRSLPISMCVLVEFFLLRLFSSPLTWPAVFCCCFSVFVFTVGSVVVCSSFSAFFVAFFACLCRCCWGLTLNKFRHSGTCLFACLPLRLLPFAAPAPLFAAPWPWPAPLYRPRHCHAASPSSTRECLPKD